MIAHQIHQVLTTYWRRAISKPFAIVAVIIPVIGVALAVIPLLTGEAKRLSFEKEQTAIMLTWIGMLGFYCPILIAIHFKQQVIQVHQRRIASAVMAHVIVVVGLLALCSVVLPTALMAIGVWSWGGAGFNRRADFRYVFGVRAARMVCTVSLSACFRWRGGRNSLGAKVAARVLPWATRNVWFVAFGRGNWRHSGNAGAAVANDRREHGILEHL